MQAAADELDVRLKVGRVLPPLLLGAAVFVRNFLLTVVSQGIVDYVAPAWVVISERRDGTELAKIAAGRTAGVGEHLHAVMAADLNVLSREEFLAKWVQ